MSSRPTLLLSHPPISSFFLLGRFGWMTPCRHDPVCHCLPASMLAARPPTEFHVRRWFLLLTPSCQASSSHRSSSVALLLASVEPSHVASRKAQQSEQSPARLSRWSTSSSAPTGRPPQGCASMTVPHSRGSTKDGWGQDADCNEQLMTDLAFSSGLH